MNNALLSQWVSPAGIQEIDHWISKYPKEEPQSAVMSALRIVQEEQGHLTQPMMDAVAEYLDMTPIAVYEVASFYTMYETAPVGRHVINVCTNIACQLCGCRDIVKHLEKKLKVKMGETTPDGRFTLRGVECLAACASAPVAQIDKQYHENLTAPQLDEILESYS